MLSRSEYLRALDQSFVACLSYFRWFALWSAFVLGFSGSCMAEENLARIQELLIWAGDYEGLVDGVRGAGTINAIRAFQKRTGSAPTGQLSAKQLVELQRISARRRAAAGFDIVTDPLTGIRIGIPTKLIAHQGAGTRGTEWRSKDGGVSIDTIKISTSDLTLTDFLNWLRSVEHREITYEAARDDWFVLSGRDGDLRFYVRAQTGAGLVQGFSIVYPQAREVKFHYLVVAMSASFEIIGAGSSIADAPVAAEGRDDRGTEWRKHVEDVRAKLKREADYLGGQHYQAIAPAKVEMLTKEEHKGFPLSLSSGVTYAIVAACDEDCSHVEVALYDEEQRPLMRSPEKRAVVIINGTPAGSGLYTADVAAPGCQETSCYAGIILLQLSSEQNIGSNTGSAPLSEFVK